MNAYDARNYWQERFSKQFDLSSVGFLGLGQPYNEWLYKKRQRVFQKTVKMLDANPSLRILDVGAGSGFYVALWKQLGVTELVGIDITQNAVVRLSDTYPKYKFIQCDFTANDVALNGQFDVITFFDVLFHIVDDRLFEQAISNAVNVLSSDGVILISDVVFNSAKQIAPSSSHFQPRSLQYYTTILKKYGLNVADRCSIFSFMHPRSIFDINIVSRTFQKMFNKLLLTVLNKDPKISSWLGRLLFYVDCVADTFHMPGNSITLMIIRRKLNAGKYL